MAVEAIGQKNRGNSVKAKMPFSAERASRFKKKIGKALGGYVKLAGCGVGL